MSCKLIQRLLRQSRGKLESLPAFGWHHLQVCEDCAAYAEDIEFAHLLRKLPLLPPSPGFTDNALQKAWQARESKTLSYRRSRRYKFLALVAWMMFTTAVALYSLLSDF